LFLALSASTAASEYAFAATTLKRSGIVPAASNAAAEPALSLS
jgi:hypothetical protein